MKNTVEFESLAKRHGLNINKNDSNYLDPKTQLARIIFDSQQVKIDNLEHDLKNERCASQILADIVRMYESKDYIQSEKRYELVRTLNVEQFKKLCWRNIFHSENFDDMVDALIKEKTL